jgi:aspartate racemase
LGLNLRIQFKKVAFLPIIFHLFLKNMKTIGLIGGMSWESSAIYYQQINRLVQQKMGGVHSARTLMFSVEFGEIARLQAAGDWKKLGEMMADAAKKLEHGGADFIVLCTNTMHKLTENIENSVKIPFLHIADPTAAAIQKNNFKKIGLLGTRFTMESDFLKRRFSEKFGIETIIPNQADREQIHTIIYDELVKGIFTKKSKKIYLKIIEKLAKSGAEGVVLGCTEIGLLVFQTDTAVKLFDTSILHAEMAVEWALD